MREIALDGGEPAAARVAAGRLALDCDDGRPGDVPAADQATMADIDAELARLNVGKP